MNVALNNIEAPALSNDRAAGNNGDGSFDSEFAAAQKALAEKDKTSLFAPWAQVQNLFNVMPLEFKFDFNTSQTEDRPASRDNRADLVKDQTESEGRKKTIETQAESRTVSVFNIPKEVLASHTPPALPFNPMAVPVFQENSSAPKITKTDMKSIIDELVEKVELLKTSRSSELNMLLSYKNSGDLMLSLSLKNGQVYVQIAASQPETRKSLEDSLAELESALKSARINLKDIRIVEVKNGDRSTPSS